MVWWHSHFFLIGQPVEFFDVGIQFDAGDEFTLIFNIVELVEYLLAA